MPNNGPRHHLVRLGQFLDNNFLKILECHDESQNEHQVCQFPYQTQWSQPQLQHLPLKTYLDVSLAFLHQDPRDMELQKCHLLVIPAQQPQPFCGLGSI